MCRPCYLSRFYHVSLPPFSCLPQKKWRFFTRKPLLSPPHSLLCRRAFLCGCVLSSTVPPPFSVGGGGGSVARIWGRPRRGLCTQHGSLLPLPQLLPRPRPRLDLLLPPVLPCAQPARPAHSHALHQCRPAAAHPEGQTPLQPSLCARGSPHPHFPLPRTPQGAREAGFHLPHTPGVGLHLSHALGQALTSQLCSEVEKHIPAPCPPPS